MPAPGKRRIAFVVPAFEDTGGVTTVTEFILRAVRRRPDLEVKLISLAVSSRDPCSLLLSRPSTWLRGPATRQGHAFGEDFTHVGAVLGEFEFQRLAPRRVLSDLVQDCDLVQVVAGVPAWACPFVGLGKPVVLQVATLTAVERRMRARHNRGLLRLWRGAMTRISDRLDHAALRKVQAVMVENPWMHDLARAEGEPRGVAVRYAPPGVDTERFHPACEAPEIPGYILAVGRFSDTRKNAPLLLEAYARMHAAMADPPRLVLAGAGGPDASFWARAEALGVRSSVEFRHRPSNHELAKLYRDAFCFALSSDEEGFGMVVIEAMASGLPVVATRCGGPDGIITEGEDGYLVARDSADEMADRLLRLATTPAKARAMGLRARRTVETRYADEVAGQAYLDIYDELLGAPASVPTASAWSQGGPARAPAL